MGRDFRTAVAQADLEDRQVRGAWYRIAFTRAGGEPVIVATTRPELLPACVALVVHPADERHAPLVGTTVRTPVFGAEVPVLAHPLADPDKGTGIVMVCTFGDVTDVTWWRELRLPTRPVIGPGRAGCCPTRRPAWPRPAAGVRQAGRAHPVGGQGPGGGPAASRRRPDRRAGADHPRGEVLREG